jgi:hypothetical protein
MNKMAFLNRVCPGCTENTRQESVKPPVSAMDSEWDAISKGWSGLYNQRMFFPYCRCDGCGMLYNPTYFNADQLDELYRSMAPNMAEAVDPAILQQTQKGYVDLVAQELQGDGGYLEIGPDIGTFAVACSDVTAFSHYWFVEPNEAVWSSLHAAFPGQATSIESSLSSIEKIPDRSLKLAVAIHVLDHIIDPLDTLRLISRKLANGGIFLAVTHDERSMLARVLGKNWPAYCLQHPHLFNTKTIAQMFTQADYRLVGVRKTSNVFPAGFLVRQGVWAGLGKKIPPLGVLENLNLKLRLGNIAAVARYVEA